MSDYWQDKLCVWVNRHPFIATVLMMVIIGLMSRVVAGCARDVKPIQNLAVRTLPPASFWICPSDTICRASNDPADIPLGYVCIKQANKVTVCSPHGDITLGYRTDWPKEKK